MIRVKNIKVLLNENYIDRLCKKIKLDKNEIIEYKIVKKSIDARKKENIHFVYTIDIKVKNERKIKFSKDICYSKDEKFIFKITGTKIMKNRPVIVGSGPAGLFCAYILSLNGYKPLVIERGEDIDNRIKSVKDFWEKGLLNEKSNVCFGEGGAGTFSDGKLNTLVKDKYNIIKKVFEIFVENGAPKEIMYENNPHIGTDVLSKVIKNIRKKIISNNGEFKFNTCLTDLKIKNNKLYQIEINKNEIIDCDNLILAIGHSARDTFRMLYKNNIKMESKNFAVGIRIQHSQEFINKSQYGKYYKILPPANYKLTYNSKDNRGVYSFCMCPGGYVVNSSSENKKIVINGMSNYKRDSENANSAIVVTVTKEDYGLNLFDGLRFQEEIEKKAYEAGNGKIPVQLLKDFYDNKNSTDFKKVIPTFKGETCFSNINDILPKFICDNLKKAIDDFDNKINGFKDENAILAVPETRTSSPLRIIRNSEFISNIKGIYPCGEGAGYAGGITTSAVDGIRVAFEISKIYKGVNNE